MRYLIPIAFALAGCAARGEPVVTSYDGFMVTITQPRAVPQREADAVAAKTCGRPATKLSKICTDLPCTQEKFVYWCR